MNEKLIKKTASKISFSNQGSIAFRFNKSLIKWATSNKTKVKGNRGMGQNSSTNSNATWKCFKFQVYGHSVVDCPNRKLVTIIENVNEEAEKEMNHEERKIEEITEYTNEEETLVI